MSLMTIQKKKNLIFSKLAVLLCVKRLYFDSVKHNLDVGLMRGMMHSMTGKP